MIVRNSFVSFLARIKSMLTARILFVLVCSHYVLFRFFTRRLLPFIAQKLIDRSTLTVDEAAIEDPTPDSLTMRMKGRVENAGPLPAEIKFNGPVKLCFEEDDDPEDDDPEDAQSVTNGKKAGGVDGAAAITATADTEETSLLRPAHRQPLERKPTKRLVCVGEADGMPSIAARNGSASLDAKVRVRVTDPEAFGRFSREMMQSTAFELTLIAEDLTVTSLGLPIHHVRMQKTITLKGLDRLSQIQIISAVATEGTKDRILLRTACDILNPSDLTLSLGDVSLDLMHADVDAEGGSPLRVGNVVMKDLTLMPGKNTITCNASYAPTTQAEHVSGRRLLAQYVTGEQSSVSIRGNAASTSFAYLRPALASLDVTTVLPGETRKMIKRTQLVIDPFRLAARFQSATRLELFNPMEATVTILWMKGKVFCRGEVIGELDEDLQGKNEVMVVPGGGSLLTGIMGMRLRLSPSAVGAIMAAGLSSGGAAADANAKDAAYTNARRSGITLFDVDVESTIGAKVGQYKVELDYRQEGVPVGIFG